GETFADFRGGHAYDGIRAAVIVGGAAEHHYAERTLLNILRLPRQGALNNVAQHIGVALAVSEEMALKQSFKLFADEEPSFTGLDLDPRDAGTGCRGNRGHELPPCCGLII